MSSEPVPTTPGLTAAVLLAINALASGEARSLRKAAKLAGITHGALSQALRKPTVVAELDRLATVQRSVDRANARNVLRALSERGRSEYVRLEASRHLDQPEDKGGLRVGGVVINIDLGASPERVPGPLLDVTPPGGLLPRSIPQDEAGGQNPSPSPPTTPPREKRRSKVRLPGKA